MLSNIRAGANAAGAALPAAGPKLNGAAGDADETLATPLAEAGPGADAPAVSPPVGKPKEKLDAGMPEGPLRLMLPCSLCSLTASTTASVAWLAAAWLACKEGGKILSV